MKITADVNIIRKKVDREVTFIFDGLSEYIICFL